MHPEAAVLQFFRAYEADLVSGSVRTADEYADAIPEHALRIRAEYRRLTEDESAAGDRVLGGRYRLVESLGRGSFGEVFLAQDTKLRRRVAVKVLDEFRALSTEWRQRLIREAEATQRIGDDGCCTVHDVGFEGDVPFLVMPWIQGQSLDRVFSTSAALGQSPVRVRDGLAPGEVLPAFLGLIEKVARTLHAAHRGGVIHRDIKPANVLVRSGGRPILIDFGLAWLDDTDGRATRSATFGTPAYSAPEVRAGNLERPDPRVDVFSLGVVLYEGLRGERPFSAAMRQGTRLHADSPPPRLDDRYGADVQAVIEAALAPDPAHRYPDMLAFADDLARLQQGESVSVRPAGRVRRAVGWVRRRPLAVGMGALLLAVGSGGITGIVQMREQAVIDEAVVTIATSLDDLAEDLSRRGKLGMTLDNRLEDARATLALAERMSQRFEWASSVDRSLARILVLVASVEIQVGERSMAQFHLDRALSLLAQIEAREGSATRADRERRSHALILCGDIRQMESDDEAAVDLFRQALRIDEALWEAFPDDARRASEVGFGYLRIAFSAMLRGSTERSSELIGRALHALTSAEELEPENLARRLHTAEAYWSRARTGIAEGASPESIQRDLAEAARRQRAWLQSYPLDAHNLRIFVLTLSLGIGHPGATAQQRKGYFEDCLKATRALQRLEPDALLDVAAVGASLAECASYLVGEGQVADGLALAEEAVTIADGVAKSATGERFAMTALAGTLRIAGLLFQQHGDRDKGHQFLRRAVEAARANFASRSSEAESVVWFARFLSVLDTEEAATEALRVLDQFRASGRGWTEELESLHTKALARVR